TTSAAATIASARAAVHQRARSMSAASRSASAYAASSRSCMKKAWTDPAGVCSAMCSSGRSGAAVIGPPYLKDQAGLRRSGIREDSRRGLWNPPLVLWTSVGNKRDDVVTTELVAAFERGQLDEEGAGDDLAL